MGFFVLKVSKILVHAFQVSHSSAKEFGEFHGVSGYSDGCFVVAVGELGVFGSFIEPSRYPDTPLSAAIERMLSLHVGQFNLSNLSELLKIGGMLTPDVVMLVVSVRVGQMYVFIRYVWCFGTGPITYRINVSGVTYQGRYQFWPNSS